MHTKYINKLSIWFGKTPTEKPAKLIPSYSYFDGGCYFKFSLYFLKYIVEFSHPKKDKTVYKRVSKKELDSILSDTKKLLKSKKSKDRQKY